VGAGGVTEIREVTLAEDELAEWIAAGEAVKAKVADLDQIAF